mmetsp:Transcript_6967/g.30635  ORF Transcript_6967/g.30635 Transcript_6967/m.30635 type:complete len:409 (+) Transcript_6967:1521-2747(+)
MILALKTSSCKSYRCARSNSLPEPPGLGDGGLDTRRLARVPAAVLAHGPHLSLAPDLRLGELVPKPLSRVFVVLAPVRGETAVLHNLLAHVALVEVADLLLERRDDASLAAVLLLLGGALAVAEGSRARVFLVLVHAAPLARSLPVGSLLLLPGLGGHLPVDAALVLVAAIPEGIAHGEVRVAARRICLLGLSAQLCHGVHEPGALLVLELLGNIHEVGHVVAKVANLRERVDGPSGGLLAPALNLGEGHAREQVLLDLGASFHAGEFALGEGALHVALVAAELLGSLPELLREFLDEGGALRPPPGLLLRPLLLGALAALLEFLHGGGHHLGRAVHAAVGALLRILVHLADERVGVGPELQGILASAVGVLFLAGDALLCHLEELVNLVLELLVDGPELLDVGPDLH